jgi:hypothetical protein
MRVIPPLAITDAMLISTTAPEPGVGEAAWASGTTYGLGDKVIIGAPTSTVTITIASPGVVSWTAHGLADATLVAFTSTGSLPTGLAVGTAYYVVNSTTDSFQLAQTADGTPIVTSGSQSGAHTATAHVHRVYESLQATNVGHPPAVADSAEWWQDDGPTNRWAMFDLLRNTATEIASPLTVTIAPGRRVNSIALLGLVADTVTITATSVAGGGTVYSYTGSLTFRRTMEWYGYFYGELGNAPNLVKFDLPAYTDLQITITLERAGGYVSCGAVVVGTNVYVGRTLHDAENDALNFSTVDRDTFGNSILIPRRTVPKVNAQVRITKTNVPRVIDLRVQLNAVPAVWAGLDEDDAGYFGALLILGIYKQFTVTADQPEEALVALELEEV